MSLTIVADYLLDRGKRGDLVTGLTFDKVNSRCSLLSLQPEDGKIYFECERHHAILGGHYTSGLGMNAFATYMQRYSFDPDSKEFTVVGDKRYLPLELEKFDLYRVAMDFVAPMGGGFRIEFDGEKWEFVSFDMGVLATAETEEEVRVAAVDAMMEMDRDMVFESIEDGMLDDQGLESLKEAVNRAIDDCIKDVVDTAEVEEW